MLVFVVISVGLVFAVSLLWGTWGLARMEFHHRLPKTHVFPGETIEYIQELANHKILPLPLLITETEVPSDCRLRKGKLSHHYKASRRLIVRLFSLRWYEKITRHYRFVCDHRGYYVFGPTRMAAGDIFGLFQTEKFFADPVAVTVFPRVLPVHFGQNLVLNPSGKAERQSFAFQDPFNITGTRNYQPGDILRTIDWKATARLAKLQVREYNAAIDSHLVIILNVNTLENAWQGVRSDALELAVMAAASIGFASLAEGSEVMLLSNGRIQSIAMDTPLTTCVPYGRGPGHSSLLLESLARLTPYSVGTYDIEKVALNSLNRLKPESRVLFITAVMNDKIQDTIHHFARWGFDTSLIFVGNRTDLDNVGKEFKPSFYRGRNIGVRWKNCDWFVVIKQILLLSIHYLLLLLLFALFTSNRADEGLRLVFSPWELALFLLLGRRFDAWYDKTENSRRKAFVLLLGMLAVTIFVLTSNRPPFVTFTGSFAIDFIARQFLALGVFAFGAFTDASDIRHDDLLQRLKLSIPVLILLLLIKGKNLILPFIFPTYATFLALSLMALVLLNYEQIRFRIAGKDQGAMLRFWYLIAGGVILTLFLLSGIGVFVFKPTFFQLLMKMLNRLLELVIMVIAVPLSLLAKVFILGLQWLLALLRNRQIPEIKPPEIREMLPFNPEAVAQNTAPTWLSTIMNVLVVSIITGAFYLLLRYLLRKYRFEQTEEYEEERESLFTWDKLGRDLGSLLQPFHGLKRVAGSHPLFSKDPVGRIRLRYWYLLLLAQRAGYRRAKSDTPDEFVPTMINAFGEEHAEKVVEMTRLYERARYNPGTVTEKEAEEAEKVSGSLKIF